MKITLVSPYSDFLSYGIRILSACLKQEGHEVRCVFARRDFFVPYTDATAEEVVDLAAGSDMVGFTLSTNYFANTVFLTRKLRERLDVPVIWGGIHPTIRPEECLEHADYVCVGEGEQAIMELVRTYETAGTFAGVQGIWYKVNGSVVPMGVAPLAQNLDALPFPDYEMSNHFLLTEERNRIEPCTPERLHRYSAGLYRTLATRGCPHACTYCCNNFYRTIYPTWSLVRKRSPENLVCELEEMMRRMPDTDRITFIDDAFMSYTLEEVREICRLYKERIALPLRVIGIAPTSANEEKLALLMDAGADRVRMGIQSASRDTLKLYKRPYSPTKLRESTEIIQKNRHRFNDIRYEFILDNPWESEKDVVDSLRFLAKIDPPYHLSCFSLTLYPGTELYDKAREENRLHNDCEEVYNKDFIDSSATYLNGLFYLQKERLMRRKRITPLQMFLLTHPLLVRTRLSWGLYMSLFRACRQPRLIQDSIPVPVPKWFYACEQFPAWFRKWYGMENNAAAHPSASC